MQLVGETLSHVHKVTRLDTKFSVTVTYLMANIFQNVNVRTKQLEDRVKTLHEGFAMLFRVGDYVATFGLQNEKSVRVRERNRGDEYDTWLTFR